MPSDETIEELVDRKIDEAIARHGLPDSDIKKRKPKPFRYITDREEIRAELEKEQIVSFSVMKPPTAPKILEDKLAILGLGDIEKIENVIRRHEISRKFQEK